LPIEVNAPRKEQFVTSMVLAELGDVYWSRGLVTKALESYLQARRVGEQAWIGVDLNRPLRMSDISYCWAIQGKSNAAAALADSAYQLTIKSTGLENPVAAIMMRSLAYCRQKQRNFVEAQRLTSAALDVFRKPGSPGQPGLATCYRDLADCSRELGNLTQSGSFCVAAAEEACRLAPSDSLLKGLLEVTLANLRAAQGQTSIAESLFLHSIEVFSGKLKKESWYHVEAYQGLGDLYLKMKRVDEARTCYEKAIASGEVSLGLDAPRVGHLLEKYATILSSLNLTKEAEVARKRASDILSST
jgi:tetratricopeptide (TPR) repeat protein